MRHHLSAFIFLFLPLFSATAQSTKPIYDYDKIWAFQANIGWQKSMFLEVGISRQWLRVERPEKTSGDFIRSISLPDAIFGANANIGGYYDFSAQQFLLGANLGGEYYYMPQSAGLLGFTARLSAAIYTRTSNPDGIDIRIMPQVGITAFSIFSLYYGYSQPILSDPISGIGRHRITFAFSLPFHN